VNAEYAKSEGHRNMVVDPMLVLAMVIGLATQDTSENAIKELGLNNLRFKNPVFHGDTVYAYTGVLGK
jgi:acyl dehydratase